MTKVSERVFIFSIYLTVITLPFAREANNFALGLLTIAWLGVKGWKVEYLKTIQNNFPALLSLSLLIIYLVGLTYSQDFSKGIKVVESLSPLLIFPVSFALLPKIRLDRQRLLNLFIYSLLIASAINLIVAVVRTLKNGLYYYDLVTTVIYNNFQYHRLSSAIGVHAGFITFFLGFALILIIDDQWHSLRINKVNKLLIIIFFIINIILLKSIMMVIGVFICIGILLGLKLIKKRKISPSTLFLSVIGLITIMSIVILSSDVKEKYFDYEFSNMPPDWNSVNLRLAFWEASFETIKKNPFFGVGPGDAQHALLETYQELGFEFAAINNYHSHNQFLYSWISVGILGVVMTLAVLFAYGYSAIKSKNIIFISLVVMMVLFSITDIPFSRNKPLVFFMLFANFFEYMNTSNSNFINNTTIRG